MQRKLLLCCTVAIALLACEKQAKNSLSDGDAASGGTLQTGGVTPTTNPTFTGLSCNTRWDYTNQNFAGISAGVAKMMSGNYQQINQPKLMIEGGIPDSKSMWLSLETMKAFIWKIEKAICNKGCTNNLNLGVRIYFGRYPVAVGMAGTPDLSGLPQTYQQHHTAFLVPTYQDPANASVQWDFDPWHWGSSNCTPTSYRTWFGNSEGRDPFGLDKSLILTLSEQQFFPSFNTNTVLNHGSLIPPDNEIGTGF
jgi:hypothetical protein